MATQVSDLRTMFQNRIQVGTLSSSIVTQFLNEAHREILNRHRYTFMHLDTQLTASTSTNLLGSLPSTLQLLRRKPRITSPDSASIALSYVAPDIFDDLYPDPLAATATQPLKYTIYNRKIYFPAKPDQAYVVEFAGIKVPTALSSDSSLMDIPDEFAELLVLGAIKRTHQRNDNYDQAQVIQQDIDSLEEDMLDRYGDDQEAEAVSLYTSPRYRTDDTL